MSKYPNPQLLGRNRSKLVKAIVAKLRKEIPGHKVSVRDVNTGSQTIKVEVFDKAMMKLRKETFIDRREDYSPTIDINVLWPTGYFRDPGDDHKAKLESRPSFVQLDGGYGENLNGKYKVRSDLTFNDKLYARVREYIQLKLQQERWAAERRVAKHGAADVVETELAKFATRGKSRYGRDDAWLYRDHEVRYEPQSNGKVCVSAGWGSKDHYVWPDEMKQLLDLVIDFEKGLDELGNERD